jgi:(E)-4-hydroxy-3-methylbut-2-enyl-diphosphate synthase
MASEKQIQVGSVKIGGGAPISIQTMTNTKITDVESTLAQINEVSAAGAEIVRCAVPHKSDIPYFREVCEVSPVPIVADIHFDHEIAIAAAENGASKLRINPGNIGSMDKVDAVIEAAGECNVPIRIGVNAGSLDPIYREKEGWSLSDKLIGSVHSFVEHFENRGFSNIVLSAKTHEVPATIEVYRRMANDFPYPLHVGVTEAGTVLQGSIKHAIALGVLFNEGIGDTCRVSLTASPVEEIHTAKEILQASGIRLFGPELVSCPTCGRTQVDLIPIAQEVNRRMQSISKPIKIAVMGCVVNGPGEAKDADIGIACGKGSGILFIHGEKVRKVSEESMVDELFSEIEKL